MFPEALPEDTCLRKQLHPATSLFPTLLPPHDLMRVPFHRLVQRGRGAEGSERRLEDALSGGPGHVFMAQTVLFWHPELQDVSILLCGTIFLPHMQLE